jgi:hypothetical protein
MGAFQVLAIDCTFDPETSTASGYRSSFVLPALQQAGLAVSELQGSHVNPAEVHAAAAAPSLRYLTGVSHGLFDTFTGDGGTSAVFTTGELDPSWTQGRVIHFLACSTAKTLGPTLVSKGPGGGAAAAFFGYYDLFQWPDDSQYADLFFDCDAEVDRSLANGATAGVALSNTIAKYNQEINGLIQLGDPVSQHLANLLSQNLNLLRGPDGLNEYGDPNATII